MSAERAGPIILREFVRDVTLNWKLPATVMMKHYRLLPLPVVGGGMPITRH